MNKIVELKKFTANFDRLARYATDGKFNSSELAIFSSLENNNKCIYDIAADIGMSCPTISTVLSLHMRKHHVIETGRIGKQICYALNDSVDPSNLFDIMFKDFSEDEIKTFMDMLHRVNGNADEVLPNRQRV